MSERNKAQRSLGTAPGQTAARAAYLQFQNPETSEYNDTQATEYHAKRGV